MMAPLNLSHKIKFAQQRAIVLVSTLWILTAMTIAISFLSVWLSERLDQLLLQQNQLELTINKHSTLSTFLYLASTRYRTRAGISPKRTVKNEKYDESIGIKVSPEGDEIRLDGKIYKGNGSGLNFSVQDESGLLNLRRIDKKKINSLFNKIGIKNRQTDKLIATLKDYVDEDDLVHINGAERFDYKKKGLKPPTNRLLWTFDELRNVINWRDLSEEQFEYIKRHTTLDDVSQFNINTAPHSVITTFSTINDEVANIIIKIRQKKPLKNTRDFKKETGYPLLIDSEDVNYLPTQQYRFRIWGEDVSKDKGKSISIEEYRIELVTYKANLAPWIIKQHSSYRLNKNDDIVKPQSEVDKVLWPFFYKDK